MVVLKHILVGTDFSEPSAVALAYGRELARTFSARLHVLHVVQDILSLPGAEFYSASMANLQTSTEAAARDQLKALFTEDDRSQLGVDAVVHSASNIPRAIVEYAETAGIDLIVMGTHGRGGLAHALMGSVAERVVRDAPCPVLTVRHPQREFVSTVGSVLAATA